MASVDITVRGAGVFGLSVAYACLKRGARVRVVDPQGVAAGASGGVVGALAPHTPENWNPKKQFQFDSLVMARSFWPEVEACGGQSTGYARSGRLQPIADAAALDLAQRRAVSARSLWGDAARWEVVEAQTHAGWAPRAPMGVLIHDTLSALIHPRQATRALAAAVRALGGEICAEAEGEGATVWATGVAGLEALSAGRARAMGNGVKGQAAVLKFNAKGAAQLFADALHIVPHGDGTVAIGSTSERDYASPTQTDGQLDDVIARALAAFPALAGAEIVQRWAGVRPRARSRAPMLGAWPGRNGHFIANGGFKIGFGMAPKLGEVMADLVLDEARRYPPEFDVEANL